MILIFAPAIPADHPRLTMRIAHALSELNDVTLLMGAALGKEIPPDLRLIEVPAESGLRRIGAAVRAIRLVSDQEPIDIIICGGIEAWTVAVLMKPFRRWKVCFEVSEDYPAAVQRWATGQRRKKMLGGLVHLIIGQLSRFTDLVILARRSNASQYARANASEFLLNSVPDETLLAGPGDPLSSRENGACLKVVSAGTFSPERGAAELLEALKLASKSIDADSIEITFVGEFVLMDAGPYIEEIQSLPVVKSVSHIGWISYSALMTEVLPSQHVGIALFQPWNDNLRNPMPNKVFDYMARGVVPIAPEWGEELNAVVSSDEAFLIDTASPKAIAATIVSCFDEELRQQMAESGLRLSWKIARDSDPATLLNNALGG